MYQYWPAPPIKTAGTCRRPSHAGLPATVAWQRSKASGKMKWVDTHKSTSILIFKQENNNMQADINLKKVASRCWVISTSSDLRLSFGLLQLSMRDQLTERFFSSFFSGFIFQHWSQTHSFLFPLVLLQQVFFLIPPPLLLSWGFLLTLALRAAVYDAAALMHIQDSLKVTAKQV